MMRASAANEKLLLKLPLAHRHEPMPNGQGPLPASIDVKENRLFRPVV